MPPKKARFVIRITDAGDSKQVKPEKMRAKDLAEVIAKFDDALSAMVKGQFGDDMGGFSILNVTKGSINVSCSGPLPYEVAFSEFGRTIIEDITPPYARSVRKIIGDLEHFNLAHNTKIELKREKKSQPLATIRKALPPAIPQEAEISGETILYGKVVGITGIERIKVNLKLLAGETIEFYVDAGMVKEFGKRYNEIIGVKGNAVWDTALNRVSVFELKEVLPYIEESPKTAFASIRTQFSDVFDGVADIEKFVRDQRGE